MYPERHAFDGFEVALALCLCPFGKVDMANLPYPLPAGGGGGGGNSGGDRHQDEINRLKMDKLELLRQNVSSQREVKRLRERETQLQTDLATASREITRLRASLLDAREKLSQRATKV